MNTLHLIILNLFRARARSNLSLALTVAIAAAAIAGSAMVGVSVRHSLRQLALKRLGHVDSVVSFPDFVSSQIAGKITGASAAIFTEGSAENSDGMGRCNLIKIHAAENIDIPRGTCIINDIAADMLNAKIGSELLCRFSKRTTISESSPMTGLKRSERIGRVRLEVKQIEQKSNFLSRFEIYPTQRPQPVIWMSMTDAQRASEASGKMNLLLVSGDAAKNISSVLKPEHLGIEIRSDDVNNRTIIYSKSVHLPQIVENTLRPPQYNRVFTGLLENCSFKGKIDHYGLASGMDLPPGGEIADDQCCVNRWLADRLSIDKGDEIEINYFARMPDGSVGTKFAKLTVKRIIPNFGSDINNTLTPSYPGMTDSASLKLNEWEVPGGLDIDLSLVDDNEEQYWEKFRATPKIYVNSATAKKLWANGQSATSVRKTGTNFAPVREKLSAIRAEDYGIRIVDVRKMQLAAAKGSSDFNSLFLSLSGLIYIAAFVLVILITALSKRSMARQFEIMSKLGFDNRRLDLLASAESFVACTFGAIIAVPFAIAFAMAIIWALSTIWIGATGTNELIFVTSTPHLLAGSIISACVCWLLCRVNLRGIGNFYAGKRIKPSRRQKHKDRKVFKSAKLTLLSWTFSDSTEKLKFAVLVVIMAISIFGTALTLHFSGSPAANDKTDRLLVVDLSAPLAVSPDTAENRRILGADENFEKLWAGSLASAVMIHRAESLSCNNMTRPSSPSVAALDLTSLQSRDCLKEFGLLSKFEPLVNVGRTGQAQQILACADTASAQYILKLKRGETLAIDSASASTKTIKLAGTFKTDCFDGELMVTNESFNKLFGTKLSFERVLISSRAADTGQLSIALSELLKDYGPQISSMTELAIRRSELTNTYLAAFRSLGVIAAALGFISVVLATYRSLLDKRRQLAMMWAVGAKPAVLTIWACGQYILAVLIAFVIALVGNLVLMQNPYAQTGKLAIVTALGAGFVVATIICQVIMTYRFTAKLDARAVSGQ